MVEHLVWDQGVAGSNPVFPTIYIGALAQLGERLLCTQEVSGSIPLGSTKKTLKKLLTQVFKPDKIIKSLLSGGLVFEN